MKNNTLFLTFAFAIGAAFGFNVRAAMEQEIPVDPLEAMKAQFSNAVQEYNYLEVADMIRNNTNGIIAFLHNNPDYANSWFKFAVNSLESFNDALANLTPERKEEDTAFWNRLSFNSLRIANLLLVNVVNPGSVDIAYFETLRIYNERYRDPRLIRA